MGTVVLGDIHKRRRNILEGEGGGLKFRCWKKLEGRGLVNQGQNSDMVEGVSKTAKKFLRLLWMALGRMHSNLIYP